MKKFLFVPAIAILALAQNVFAADGYVRGATIENIGVIATDYGQHKAGNMEVKIRNGFSLPQGVTCDRSYITTLKTNDPDRAMLSLLRDARNSGRLVTLVITDNPAYTAYPGRCSLLVVGE